MVLNKQAFIVSSMERVSHYRYHKIDTTIYDNIRPCIYTITHPCTRNSPLVGQCLVNVTWFVTTLPGEKLGFAIYILIFIEL